MLLEALNHILEPVRSCFFQRRVYLRFVQFLTALFCASGRRTLSAALPEGQDFSAFYRLFSQAWWSLEGMFDQVLLAGIPYLGPKPFLPVALDDTHLKKTGRLRGLVRLLHTGQMAHPRPQLAPGLRWLHAALLVFVPKEGPMALTIGLTLAQPLKPPKRRDGPEAWARYRKESPQHSAPAKGVMETHRIRTAMDRLNLIEKTLLLVVDSGYMNRRFLQGLPERAEVLGRVRKDLHLVQPPRPGSRQRFYGDRLPTPDAIRQGTEYPWQESSGYFGGALRPIRFKEVGPLYWPQSLRHRPARLIIVAPTPYWLPGKRRKGYNLPAYLLTTDLTTPAVILIQTYFERWQIEVLHRDLKTELGSAHPQVWNRHSVDRVVPAMAAFHAFLRLANLVAFGPGRNSACYPALPKYRHGREPSRPSLRDLIGRLRLDAEAAWGAPLWRVG